MSLTDRDRRALAGVLTDAHFPELPNFQRGKVRDSYDLPDRRRIMIATDRQSAFDQVLAAVPFKGQTLTQTARFWFDETADLCPNHVLEYPDPNVVVGWRLDMLPVEFVVRDYLTGSTGTSIWPMYQRGMRELYGHRLPEGLVKNAKLPETLITPTTKGAAGEHDRPVTAAEIITEGLMSRDLWDEAAARSLAVFGRGREIAAEQGLILVDTKFEFGLDEAGRLVLADEILTPDSSRYWHAASYPDRHARGAEPESLDKEFLRLWIRERCDPYSEPIPEIPEETLMAFSARYVRLFETVTGQSFQYPDPDVPVRARVRAALASTFPEYF
ncbi:MAG TPA: phosphoribosylaminoimidazolesuccinocarboxamide synthase [Kiloniellales bacterium]